VTWMALWVGISWAGDTQLSPSDSAPGECPRSFAVVTGEPLPAELVEGRCIARCGGVVQPTSDVAYLLSLEAEGYLHIADIQMLKIQRRDLRAQLAQERSPWLHRAQGAGLAGLVTVAIWGGWYYGRSTGG
jgi:hypothetical protein